MVVEALAVELMICTVSKFDKNSKRHRVKHNSTNMNLKDVESNNFRLYLQTGNKISSLLIAKVGGYQISAQFHFTDLVNFHTVFNTCAS